MRTILKDTEHQQQPLEFNVKNYNAIVKQFDPLISKFSYQFYKQYHTIIDLDDARQEVLMCLYRCLTKYSSKQFKFITYFWVSFRRMQCRYYYSYFHQINLAQLKDETSMASDGKRVITTDEDDSTKSDERYVDQKDKHDVRQYLSDDSLEVYDVYMRHFKISPWLVSQDLKLSRYYAKERYDKFKKELQKICDC